MSISKLLNKIKGINEEVYVIAVIIFVGTAGFGLGRMSVNDVPGTTIKKDPIRIVDNSSALASAGSAQNENLPTQNGEVVGTKNGSKYHYPWCSGAKNIAENNKITFTSIEAAKSAGYTPAANCKGLK